MPPKVIKQKKRKFSDDNEKKFITLYNYINRNYKNIQKDTFINIMKRDLMGIIESNPKWGMSMRENLMFMISKYLYNLQNNDRYVKIYSVKGMEYIEKTKNIEEKNQLDAKEEVNYRDRSYFLNILDNHPEPQNLNEHYKYLLLSMLVLQPPLRTDFYTTSTLLETLDRNNKKSNYIYFYNRGKIHAYYIVNDDKASTYKTYAKDKSLSKIEIIDDSLAKLMNDSFKQYPRKHLFENSNGKPVIQNTLLKWLRSITKLPQINFDMFRSIYVTWFYKNNLSYGSREVLARQMRHSQSTASKNYLKIFPEDLKPNEQIEKIKTDNDQKDYQVQMLKEEIRDVKINEGDELYNKRRSDVLYRINKKSVTPKGSTLDKYNIKFNDETKLYE